MTGRIYKKPSASPLKPVTLNWDHDLRMFQNLSVYSSDMPDTYSVPEVPNSPPRSPLGPVVGIVSCQLVYPQYLSPRQPRQTDHPARQGLEQGE